LQHAEQASLANGLDVGGGHLAQRIGLGRAPAQLGNEGRGAGDERLTDERVMGERAAVRPAGAGLSRSMTETDTGGSPC
jgi:hypothetical protein